MKILITGSRGMVGKNICSHPFFLNQELLTPSSKELNLLIFKDVNNYIEDRRPDLIIHCAGKVGGIQANIADPVAFLTENYDMGKNIVIAARDNNVKKLINMGSSCMYPRNINDKLTEDMVLKGELEPTNEGYAIAKIAVARLCDYISKTCDELEYKTLVPCNLYGLYDKFSEKNSHMIPAVIKKIHDAKKSRATEVEIWGDGTARREFMFASELANFCAYSVKNYESMPGLLNVGLGHDYTIREYYEAIAKVIGYEGDFFYNLDRPVGMNRKLVSIDRLESFGWSSSQSLVDGLKETYRYYLNEVL